MKRGSIKIKKWKISGGYRHLGGGEQSHQTQDKWWLLPLDPRFKIKLRVEHFHKSKAHKCTQRCLSNPIL